MCLAVPGVVLEIEGDEPAFRRGSVDFSGIRREVSLAFVPEVKLAITCWCTPVSPLL